MSRPARIDGAELLAHAGFVRAMARGVLGADDRVDDVVQDAFLAALALERPPSRWSSWLASVGRRRALDVRRRDARRGVHERRAARPEVVAAAEDMRERAEVTRRLVHALLALEEPYREVLLLRYWEGLPPRAIAARLSAPVETVRTRIKRGHERLRARMDEAHSGRRETWAAVLARWADAGTPAPTGGGGGALARALSRPAVALGAIGGGAAVVVAVVLATRASDGAGTWTGDVESETRVAEGGRGGERRGLAGAARADGAGRGTADAGAGADAAGPDDQVAPALGVEVRGVVRDRSGAPVVGIPVSWSLEPLDPAVPRPGPDSAYTDAEGRYVVRGLVPGRIRLALASERALGPSLDVEHDLRGSWSHDFAVTGEIRLAGEVVGVTPQAFDLWLVRTEQHHADFDGSEEVARRAPLGVDGRSFRFTALQPGRYEIGLSGPGLARVRRTLDLYGDTGDLRLDVSAAHRVAGRVVVSPRLAPGRVDVSVATTDGRFRENATCDDDGAFAVDGVPAGEATVEVWHAGRRLVGGNDVSAHTSRIRRLSVPLADDRLEIPLDPDEDVGLSVRLPTGVNSVSGIVEVVEGAGVGRGAEGFAAEMHDGHVTMRPTEREFVWPPILHATPDGAFLVRGCARGRCVVRVTVPGYETVERALAVEGPTTLDVDLVPAKGRAVHASIQETWWAVDARRVGVGEPWKRILWQDARIVVSHSEPAGVTAATLPSGSWEFRATTRTHAPAYRGPVTVEPDARPLFLEFAWPKEASLSGRLRSASGLPADLLLFVFRREDVADDAATEPTYARLEAKETRTEGGVYRFDGLAPGRYRVSPSIEGTPVLGEVDVSDVDVTLDLALPR